MFASIFQFSMEISENSGLVGEVGLKKVCSKIQIGKFWAAKCKFFLFFYRLELILGRLGVVECRV